MSVASFKHTGEYAMGNRFMSFVAITNDGWERRIGARDLDDAKEALMVLCAEDHGYATQNYNFTTVERPMRNFRPSQFRIHRA